MKRRLLIFCLSVLLAAGSYAQEANGTDIPPMVDNSTSPYFPAVVDQHGSSCAQAACMHYLFTYEMNRKLNRRVADNPDEYTYSYRWTWNYVNGGKDEGSMYNPDAFNITSVAGALSVSDYGNENEYPFRWVTGYEKYYRAMHYKTVKATLVSVNTRQGIEQVLRYLYDKQDGLPGGGLAVYAFSDNWNSTGYSGPSNADIDEILTNSGSRGSHAMTIVGYDLAVEWDCDKNGVIEDDEKGAFIMVNSWGRYWGDEGKAYVPFSYYTRPKSQGGVYAYHNAEVLFYDTDFFEPTVTVKANISYDSRNDLCILFGVADGVQAKYPSKVMNYPIVKAQGGDYLMQGNLYDDTDDIEMGFDLSELYAEAQKMKAPCWFVTIQKVIVGSNGKGKVNTLTLYDYSGEKEKSYTVKFKDNEGTIRMGTNYYKIPTSDLFKNSQGQWYHPVKTTASDYLRNPVYYQDYNHKRTYGVQKANGGYAKIMVTDYDPKTRKIKFKVNDYE